MKIKFFFFAFLFSSIETISFAKQHRHSNRPLVVTSLSPYKFLIESLAENTLDVLTIVPPQSDPHTYEPTPKHISKIKKSFLWIRIGESFETFYEKILNTSSLCHIVDIRNNVTLLSYSGCSHKHNKNSSQSFDSHIWLSPKLLKIQLKTIYSTLCELLPEYQKLYEKNYINLINQIDNLHKNIEEIFEKQKPSFIAVVHPAFAYFCKDYNITQISIENGLSIDPSIKYLTKILLSITEHNIKTIFLQKNQSNKIGIVVAEKLKLKPIIVDPYQENVLENLKYLALVFSQS